LKMGLQINNSHPVPVYYSFISSRRFVCHLVSGMKW
jgi:hypothetical protein